MNFERWKLEPSWRNKRANVAAFEPRSEDREETKGRFQKRVVLANVPLFRVFVPGEHAKTYPRSGFGSGGTSECTLVPDFVPGEHPKNLSRLV